MIRKFIISVVLTLSLINQLSAQTDTAFWFVIPRVTPSHCSGSTCPGGQPVYLVLAALGPTTVTISMPANPSFTPITYTFTAAGSTRIDLSSYINALNPTASIENYPYDQVLNKGLYIKSDRNFITVYYEVDEYWNRDIYALKGKNALGTEFIVPFQRDDYISSPLYPDNGYNGNYNPELPYSTINIVATENNTIVEITPSVAVYKATAPGSYPANVTFTVTLNKGQTYTIRALNRTRDAHMGGTRIKSNKKIAITISDDSVQKKSCRDLEGDQNIPVNIIGKEYIVMRGRIDEPNNNNPNPMEGTSSGEQFYIWGAEDNTSITINGVPQGTINKGGLLRWNIANNSTYVSANKPVYVYHVTGVGCEAGAAVLPTIDGCTGSKSVVIVRSTDEKFYLNIMTTTTGKKYMFLQYDSSGVTVTKPIPESFFEQVGSTDWWVLKANRKDFSDAANATTKINLPINQLITVYNKEDRFHLGVMNGGGSTGAKYGYFSDYSDNRGGASVLQTGAEVYEACYGEDVQLVASGGLSYAWWRQGSSVSYLSDTSIANPVASPPTGVHIYKVKMKRACYPDTTMTVAVNMLPQVVALFKTDTAQLCSRPTGNRITFYNTSPNPDTLEFYWDFNGDNIPELNNVRNTNPIVWNFPRNTGSSPVTYKVTLFAFLRNNSSCLSSYSKNITIYPEIDASFTASQTSGCNPLQVTYTNTSSGHLSGVTYLWDFGDNNTTSATSPTHTFTNYGNSSITYTTRLIATTTYYCRDTATMNFTVHPYIASKFTVDTTRGCADLTINIRNISEGPITQYNWTFGDGQTSTSSAATLQKIYTNNTANPLVRNLKLVVRNAAGCRDSLIRPITVLPKVNATFTTSVTDGCNPLSVAFTGPTNAATVSYLWEFGDGNSSSVQSPTHVFENTTTAPKVFTTKLTVTSADYCVATFTNNIQVREKIQANFSVNKSRGCSGFITTITNLSVGGSAIVNYVWDFGDGSPLYTTTPGTQPATFTHQYNNNTNATVVYTLKLTVNNSFGCTSTYSVPITVHPGVAASFTVDKTAGCVPLTVNFTNTTDLNKVNSLKWEFGDNTSSNSYHASHTYSHLQSTDQTYKARLIAVSTGTGCIDTTEIDITAYAYIKSSFTVSNNEGCSPLNVNITNTSVGGITSRTWSFGDGTYSYTTATNFTRLYTNTTNNPNPQNLTLKLIVQNSKGCKDSSSATVIVKPQAFASFSPNKTSGCTPLTVGFTNQSNSISTSYYWDFGDGSSSSQANPTHVFDNLLSVDKTYSVKLTATTALGCTDDTTINITAFAKIAAGFSIDDALICSHTPVQITNNSTGGVVTTMWDFNGDNVTETTNNSPTFMQPFYNNTTNNININVMQVVKNNHACYDTAYKLIEVKPRVVASFTPSSLQGCHPLNVTFTNTSNIKDNPGTTFYWDFGDNSTSTQKNVSHTFENYTASDVAFPVRLTVMADNLCSDDTVVNITTYPYVQANFSILQPSACSYELFTIQNGSSPGSTRNYWDFSGTGAQNIEINSSSFTRSIVNTDVIPRVYNIRLIADNGHGCYDTIYKPITIQPVIIPDFTMNVSSGCQPLTVNFTNTSNIVSSPAAQFLWDFGDNTSHNGKHASHTFTNLTANDVTFPVKLTATSEYNCSYDTVKYVTAYAYIKAQMTLPSSAACSGSLYTINNASTPGVKHSYWLFGDGTPETEINTPSVTHIYTNTTTNPITRQIRLVVTNNHAACRDTVYNTIDVYPQVIANFSMNRTEGCEPVQVTFTNLSNIVNNSGTRFYWDFADGNSSSDKHPSHYFYNSSGNDTVYLVKLITTSEYNCSDTIVQPVIAYARIAANFTVENNSICAPGNLIVHNDYLPGVKYNYWDFNGDGTIDTLINAKTFSWLYRNNTVDPETINVKLTVKNNHECYKSSQEQIIVYPQVVASFVPNKFEGCQPITVNFNNTTNIKDKPGTKFYWYFGDGSTSEDKNTQHTFINTNAYDVTFPVKLVVRSAYHCQDDTIVNIKAYSFVKAGFTLPKAAICSDLENLTIINNSLGDVSRCVWQYRNGDDYYYEDKRSVINDFPFYNITLDTTYVNLRQYVYNSHNCVDSTSKTVMVFPRIEPSFIADNYEGCQPLTVNFQNQTNIKDIPGTSFVWDFGDGNSSNQKNSTSNTYINLTSSDQTYTVTLTVRSRENCVTSTYTYITAYSMVDANFALPTNEMCSGTSVPIQDRSTGGITQKYWDFTSDGTYDRTGNMTSIGYDNLGTETVINNLKLKVVNSHGCADSITREVKVFPKVTADFTYDSVGCTPFRPGFRSTSRNATLFEWTFGDGGTSPLQNPTTKEYVNNTDADKIYQVKLVASSQYRCYDSITKPVKVAHRPIARISVNKIIGCPPLTVTINNMTKTSGSTYYWDYGDGDKDTLTSKVTRRHSFTINPNRTTNQPYVIKLRAVTPYGCDDSTSVTVNVYPKVTAMFDTTYPDCNPIQTTIRNRSFNATDFLWDFGDGTTSNQRNPTHLFNNETQLNKYFTVKLKAWSEYGCTDSFSRQVLVYPGPDANFNATPIAQFYPNATIKITNRTNKGPWFYHWDFGNGDTMFFTAHTDSFEYTYPRWGKYTIRLHVYSSKCADTTTQNIVIYAPQPIARFDSSAEGCMPLTVRFKNKSVYGERFLWEFDDGTVSNVESPVHTFVDPGEYNVKLTVYAEGGIDAHYERVKVYPRPIIDFNVEPQLAMIPDDRVQFFNNTQYGDRYIWHFGDGETSDEPNPSHYYKNLGNYSVKLIAISNDGCIDSLERVNVVQVIGKGKIEFPNAFTPSLSGPKGGKYDPQATDNDIFFPYHEGVAQYRLEIYDRWGERLFVSEDINVGWDGYYKGKLCKQGVYVYKARGKFYNGRTFVKTGDVTLIHKD